MPEGSQKRKATRVRSLRQRWIVNSVVPIFVLLALIVGGVSLGISNYYYKGMLDGLERQARAQSGAFVDYFMDQGFANYLQRANQAISDYADKERVEMQFLSSIGRIQASIGGGRIRVDQLDGVAVDFTGIFNTLIVRHMDVPGELATLTKVLSDGGINIANMSLVRDRRGGSVMTIFEIDQPVPAAELEQLKAVPQVLGVIYYEKEDD